MAVCEGEFNHDEIIEYSKKAIMDQTKVFSYIGYLFTVAGIMLIVFKYTKILDLSFLAFLILACGILIVAIPYILAALTPKIMNKQNLSIINGFYYKYEFEEEVFHVYLKSEDLKSENTLKYSYIYKTYILDDVVYIYLNSNTMYMLKLNDISEDDKKYILNKITKAGKK